jgi:hypothetical protein
MKKAMPPKIATSKTRINNAIRSISPISARSPAAQKAVDTLAKAISQKSPRRRSPRRRSSRRASPRRRSSKRRLSPAMRQCVSRSSSAVRRQSNRLRVPSKKTLCRFITRKTSRSKKA